MTLSADLIDSPGARTARWIGAALLLLVLSAARRALALRHGQKQELAAAAAGPTIVEMLPAPAVPLDSPDVAPGPQVEEAMLAPAPSFESKPEVVPEPLPKLEPAPL